MLILLIDDKRMVTEKKVWKDNYSFHMFLFFFIELINLIHVLLTILSHVIIKSTIRLFTQM